MLIVLVATSEEKQQELLQRVVAVIWTTIEHEQDKGHCIEC